MNDKIGSVYIAFVYTAIGIITTITEGPKWWQFIVTTCLFVIGGLAIYKFLED